jgi:hypothetical protein
MNQELFRFKNIGHYLRLGELAIILVWEFWNYVSGTKNARGDLGLTGD